MAQQSSVKQPEYDIAKVFKEIRDDSDRAAAITAVAYFEEILALAIAARLVDLTNLRKNALFHEGKGPLNTFYARVLMGYALGLNGPKNVHRSQQNPQNPEQVCPYARHIQI